MNIKLLSNLLKNSYNRFFTVVFRITGNAEDTEDVIQNSLVKAWKNFGEFQEKSKLSTWFYRILINEALNYSKQRKKLPVKEYADMHNISEQKVYDHINSFGICSDKVINEKTRQSCLQMFMNCMPDSLRVVYTLRIILEISTNDTAEILGISSNNVKTRLSRARSVIRNHFAGRCSLIKKGAMCNCRSYAEFLVKNGKADKLIRVDIMRNEEKKATAVFTDELNELYQIESFYRNTICVDSNDRFKERVISMIDSGNFELLKASNSL